MDQESQDSEEEPSNCNLLKLIEKQQPVSLENFEKQEAFLVGRNLFNSSVKKFQIGVVTDVGICKELFEKFSPKQSLFDLWDFRYAWYLGYHHSPCFFVLSYEDKPVGLLPLWYENDKKIFSWFGSYWMEDNTFWVFKKECIPLLLAICPERTFLKAIYLEQPFSYLLKLDYDEPKYILDLTNIFSYENFLATLKCKQRKKLKRDLRIINNQNPKIIQNRFSDIETSFELCKKRFKQDSDCLDPRRREVFRQIIKQAKNYQIKIISVEINNQIVTVALICLYKNTYYVMKEPKNISQFPGIGTYINLFQIQDAINLGCKKIDFLEGDYNWKSKFLTPVPLYCFRKGLTKEEIIF